MDQYVGMEMEGQIVLDDENLLGRGIDLGEGAIKGDELIDADAAVLGIGGRWSVPSTHSSRPGGRSADCPHSRVGPRAGPCL